MSSAASSSVELVVGIAGGSASGKSTVVVELERMLGDLGTAVLRHDAYYHDLAYLPFEQRIEVNVDHPDSLETDLLVRHVGALRDGEPVEMPCYDYVTQTRGPTGIPIDPAPVLILEGLFTLWDERLRALLDLGAFVATTERERLERRIERDTLERGRDRTAVVEQHERRVQPMHERFVEPSRAWADVVIPGGGLNLDAVGTLADRIRGLLGR